MGSAPNPGIYRFDCQSRRGLRLQPKRRMAYRDNLRKYGASSLAGESRGRIDRAGKSPPQSRLTTSATARTEERHRYSSFPSRGARKTQIRNTPEHVYPKEHNPVVFSSSLGEAVRPPSAMPVRPQGTSF
jgi:hypothetical protein